MSLYLPSPCFILFMDFITIGNNFIRIFTICLFLLEYKLYEDRNSVLLTTVSSERGI